MVTTSHHAEVVARLSSVSRPRDPTSVFAGADDSVWLWANTHGTREIDELREILPGLPSSDLQMRFTGKEGDEALEEAHLLASAFKAVYQRHRGPLEADSRVLDFGCGWGRILRFFLRDVPADCLWGIDTNAQLIDFCRESLPACHFEVNDAFPPTSLAEASFELAYAYSVFSHFSEEMHHQWLQELRRLLAPGGILVATIRRPEFIRYTARMGPEGHDVHESHRPLAGIFGDANEALRAYDVGDFVYTPYRVSGYGDWWGEAVIPRRYVERHWSKLFDVVDFIDEPDRFKQNLVVLRRQHA